MDINVDYLSNRLTVEGPPEAVSAAKALLVPVSGRQAEGLAFARILPIPDDGFARGGDPDMDFGYAAQDAWGSWGDPLVPAVVEDGAGRFSVTFMTAGGAPHKVMKALSERLPDATVRLECVSPNDPREVSASGTWSGGAGALEKVEASREHYRRVRPGMDQDWEVDDLFEESAGPAI